MQLSRVLILKWTICTSLLALEWIRVLLKVPATNRLSPRELRRGVRAASKGGPARMRADCIRRWKAAVQDSSVTPLVISVAWLYIEIGKHFTRRINGKTILKNLTRALMILSTIIFNHQMEIDLTLTLRVAKVVIRSMKANWIYVSTFWIFYSVFPNKIFEVRKKMIVESTMIFLDGGELSIRRCD